jgi:hypothetical protein
MVEPLQLRHHTHRQNKLDHSRLFSPLSSSRGSAKAYAHGTGIMTAGLAASGRNACRCCEIGRGVISTICPTSNIERLVYEARKVVEAPTEGADFQMVQRSPRSAGLGDSELFECREDANLLHLTNQRQHADRIESCIS